MRNRRLVVFSPNYNAPAPLDPFRQAFFQFLKDSGVDILLIQSNTFFYDLSSEEKIYRATRNVIEGMETFEPDAALFINFSGRTKKIANFLAKSRIPTVTWAWDHPAYNMPELLEPAIENKIAVANKTFLSWFKNSGLCKNPMFLPFPCFQGSSEKRPLTAQSWNRREIPLVFMGTLWNPTRFEERIAKVANNLDVQSDGLRIYDLLERAMLRLNVGLGIDNPKVKTIVDRLMVHYKSGSTFLNDLDSYFSSKDRIQILRAFIPGGLRIYGPVDGWRAVLGCFLPEFRTAFQFENVTDGNHLAAIIRNTRIGINIFHRQNQNGGTNFRVLEYAMARTLILSTPNRECERIFENRRAAYYFETAKEALAIIYELEKRPAHVAKVANNAYEIALAEFDAGKVIDSLLGMLNLRERIRHQNAGSLLVLKGVEKQTISRDRLRLQLQTHQYLRNSIRTVLHQAKEYNKLLRIYAEDVLGNANAKVSLIVKTVAFFARLLRRVGRKLPLHIAEAIDILKTNVRRHI